jgi:acetoin utilization deacetylase AcuC-like enzyme
MRTEVYLNNLSVRHEVPSSHPERAERLARIVEALKPLPSSARFVVSDRAATVEEIVRVHETTYVEQLLRARGHSFVFDEETVGGSASVDAALAAVGTCLDMVDALAAGRAEAGFALVRPPGHHAMPGRAMGYCLLNNVAVAAAHARATGLERVAIIDWDAHLGNGTQAIFAEDPSVLVIDLHQENLFPAGGRVGEIGLGAGRGTTVNVPLPSGSTAEDYLAVLEQIVEPLVAWHRPGLVLVSCGFDAAFGDPEAGMDVAPNRFADFAMFAAKLATRCAAGRVGFVLEGGYALESLGTCARGVVEGLSAYPRPDSSEVDAEASPLVADIIDQVRHVIAAALPEVFPARQAS